MRKSIIATFTAAVAVAAALLLTGCERAIDMTGKPVSFAAGISDAGPFSRFGQPQTRVSYGSYASGSTSQALDWQEGDRITIYCAQCENKQSAVYKVQDITEATTGNMISYAGLANAESDGAGLRWGTGDHTFYAVYPQASATAPVTTIAVNVITGTIPASQGNNGVSGTDAKVVAPDMRNMYMTAKAGPYEPESDDVTLDFQPLTTVLEFTITKEDTDTVMEISSISLTSEGHALSGSFSADLDDTDHGHYGRPKTGLASGTTKENSNSVTISFGDSPVELEKGQSLTFTFFLNPGNGTVVEDEYVINDLTFSISGEIGKDGETKESFNRKTALKTSTGTGVAFPTHQKTRIGGLMLPDAIAWTVNYAPTVQSWNQSGTGIDPMPETDGTPFVTSWDTDIDDELTLTDPYNGHEYVEIGGIKWATCNIGANSPKDYGWYFSWGGTTGYVRDGSKWVTAQGGSELSGGFSWANAPYNTGGVKTSWNKYIPTGQTGYWSGGGSPDNKLSLELDDDAVRANLGGSWRMPTQADFQTLYEACGGTGASVTPTALPSANPGKGIYWVKADQTYISDYAGVAGLLFCDGENMLFFVAAGYGTDAFFNGDGSGRYWLGTVSSTVPSSAYYLSFIMPGTINRENVNARNQGYTVRPVAE